MKYIEYRKCSTCQRIKKYLEERGYVLESIDVKEDVITADDIKKYHEVSGLEIKKFFNTSGLVYKDLDLKNKLEEYSYEQKLELLSQNGMLIKRPILITEDRVYVARDIEKNII